MTDTTKTLALYGHPFSSYTWKALIPLYANGTEFDFHIVDADHPANLAVVNSAGPHGKFPVLSDGEHLIFEATSIIEYLHLHYPGPEMLLPSDPDAAIGTRMLDRVFDNYVMNTMQVIVDQYLRNPENLDQFIISEVQERLTRTYAWLEDWLQFYPAMGQITLIECAAAPSLFYSDWVHEITDEFPRLKRWRTHLLALPPVKRCVDDARPYRPFFPLGAPDRD